MTAVPPNVQSNVAPAPEGTGKSPRLVAQFDTASNVTVGSGWGPGNTGPSPEVPANVKALDTVSPPKPVYLRDGDSTALVQTAMAAAQWTPTHYLTPDGRPLWHFVGDREGATIAAGDGSGGIWHVYTGPVVTP